MNAYTNLARRTIEEYVKNHRIIKIPDNLPNNLLRKRAGVFISIHQKNAKPGEEDLRGCIGTVMPTKENIAQEIIDNAISASSRDYRFSAINKDELDKLDISVDILGSPESIDGVTSLNTEKYGVIVKSENGRTGLLLPNLPGIDDPEYQIAIARQKAGILASENVYLYRFETTRYKE